MYRKEREKNQKISLLIYIYIYISRDRKKGERTLDTFERYEKQITKKNRANHHIGGGGW